MIDRGDGGRKYSRKKNGPIVSGYNATTDALKNPAVAAASEPMALKKKNTGDKGNESKRANGIQYGHITSTGDGRMTPVKDNLRDGIDNYRQFTNATGKYTGRYSPKNKKNTPAKKPVNTAESLAGRLRKMSNK